MDVFGVAFRLSISYLVLHPCLGDASDSRAIVQFSFRELRELMAEIGDK